MTAGGSGSTTSTGECESSTLDGNHLLSRCSNNQASRAMQWSKADGGYGLYHMGEG